ncbi:MAG: LysM peptidoglycan-binding domain-containing protein [Gammaproteobacteria bacterium]|nr:LysM peptidoglycan-binding domain-containing protein [Gammaproteobacteria bacterium]
MAALAATILGLATACSTSQSRLEQSSAAIQQPIANGRLQTSRHSSRPTPGRRAVGQVTPSPVLVNPRHPGRHVVVPGDTLWDIASMFLQDPWYWPEIWQINPQVENPHLIYPGDVLSLVYLDGQPVIQLERGAAATGDVTRLSPRVRSQPLEEAIPTIPFETLRGFLSRPAVVETNQLETLPYVFAQAEGLVGSAGQDVYVRGTSAPAGTVFSLLHLGDELIDPDDGEVLGYEGLYVGQGRISRSGDPSTLLLTESARETLNGDYLLADESQTPANYFPRAPESEVDGTIISVIDGISLIGQYQVVVLNRGSRDGLEPGHVLRAYRAGEVVTDEFDRTGLFADKVRLPDVPAGTMMVFRIFDRMSYALVMEATNDIRVMDIVRNP